MTSRKLWEAVKLSNMKSSEIAARAEMSPSTFSRIITGLEKVKPGDPRVLRIAKILNLKPEECFVRPEEIFPFVRKEVNSDIENHSL